MKNQDYLKIKRKHKHRINHINIIIMEEILLSIEKDNECIISFKVGRTKVMGMDFDWNKANKSYKIEMLFFLGTYTYNRLNTNK